MNKFLQSNKAKSTFLLNSFSSYNGQTYIPLENKQNIQNNLFSIYLNQSSRNLKYKTNDYNNLNIKKTNIKHVNINTPNTFEYSTKQKKLLILDLDETLVHTSLTPFKNRKSDLILNIKVNEKNYTLHVLKRPFLEEFLFSVSEIFDIFIFTASISQYANPLLDEIDKKNLIKKRLFRQHCNYCNGVYIKDLKIFQNENIENMIIIDNNPLSYLLNQDNGLPIKSWYEDPNDIELKKLIPILKILGNTTDVRTLIKKFVDQKNNKIDFDYFNDRRRNNSCQIIKRKNSFNKLDSNNSKNNNNNKINPINSNEFNLKTSFEKNININIDKKDPNGTRQNIFAPEEYNFNYSYKNNLYDNDRKNNNKDINLKKSYTNFNNNSNKCNSHRSYNQKYYFEYRTSKVDIKTNNNFNDENYNINNTIDCQYRRKNNYNILSKSTCGDFDKGKVKKYLRELPFYYNENYNINNNFNLLYQTQNLFNLRKKSTF